MFTTLYKVLFFAFLFFIICDVTNLFCTYDRSGDEELKRRIEQNEKYWKRFPQLEQAERKRIQDRLNGETI